MNREAGLIAVRLDCHWSVLVLRQCRPLAVCGMYKSDCTTTED